MARYIVFLRPNATKLFASALGIAIAKSRPDADALAIQRWPGQDIVVCPWSTCTKRQKKRAIALETIPQEKL